MSIRNGSAATNGNEGRLHSRIEHTRMVNMNDIDDSHYFTRETAWKLG